MWRRYIRDRKLDKTHPELMRPWDNQGQDVIRVAASGDDQLVGVLPEHAKPFAEFYKRYSARSPMEDRKIGLGQAIADIKVTTWDKPDFLSLVPYTSGGKLYLVRDLTKLFSNHTVSFVGSTSPLARALATYV